MELRLERLWPKETYTIGRLYINNEFFCNTLEDKIVDKNKNGIMEDDEKLEEQAYIRYLAEKDDEGEEDDDFDNGESV